MAEQAVKRTLVVTDTNQIASGKSQHGEWVLYEVFATDEQGQPVSAPLRCFRDLTDAIGKPVEYDVERQVHEKYGEQFLLKPPKRDLKQSVDELRTQLRDLAARVERLEAGAPAGVSPGSQSRTTAPTSDDDIPF